MWNVHKAEKPGLQTCFEKKTPWNEQIWKKEQRNRQFFVEKRIKIL